MYICGIKSLQSVKKENSGSFKGLTVKCGKPWHEQLPYSDKTILLLSNPVCWDLT